MIQDMNNNGKTEKSSMKGLDKVDLQILSVLQRNARITLKELAAKVKLSATPVFERWKKLDSMGVITRYVAIVDAEKVHRGFCVFCMVKLRQLTYDVVTDFVNVMQKIPEVTECYHISGRYDYLLKINAPDMKYYKNFIVNVLGHVDSIGTIESSFVMDVVKQNFDIIAPKSIEDPD